VSFPGESGGGELVRKGFYLGGINTSAAGNDLAVRSGTGLLHVVIISNRARQSGQAVICGIRRRGLPTNQGDVVVQADMARAVIVCQEGSHGYQSLLKVGILSAGAERVAEVLVLQHDDEHVFYSGGRSGHTVVVVASEAELGPQHGKGNERHEPP